MIWNDGPRLKDLRRSLENVGLEMGEQAKAEMFGPALAMLFPEVKLK